MGKTKQGGTKYNQYSREALEKAIEAVRGGMSCSSAARDFGVPRKTLGDHVSGKSTLTKKSWESMQYPTRDREHYC